LTLFKPETSISIQKRHPYTRNLNSETSGDSKNVCLHCGDVLAAVQDSQCQAQPDELIDFHHLKARRGMSQIEIEDQVQTDLQRATGLAETGSENAARLNRVLQLTGASLSSAQPLA